MTSRSTKQFGPKPVEQVVFIIKADNRPDVLARVVMLFHRLNVEINALSMLRRRGSGAMRMKMTVEAERERAVRIEAHLYKVVHVRSVKTELSAKDVLSGETVGDFR